MKKIMTIVALVFASICVRADFTFDNGMITFDQDSSFDLTITKGWGNSKYNFGYFTYDANGNRVEKVIAIDNSGGTFTVDGLNAGDSIGFYYVDSHGKYIYSDEAGHKGGDTMTSLGGTSSGGESFNLGKGNSSSSGIQFTVDSMIKQPTPSGQPLPGILLTLLIGGSGFFGASKILGKRKKA